MHDNEEKKQIHQYIIEGNFQALANLLKSASSDSDINYPDESGLSPLCLAIALGYMKKKPEIIKALLAKRAIIKNGKILKPDHFPKLITRYANARNLQYIFKKYREYCKIEETEELILEIGSGDGYLKYLLGLCNDRFMDHIKNRLIETEPSAELVLYNRQKGKSSIQAGIENLENFFSYAAFPLIISMNVLDILTDKELKRGLRILHRLLQKEGILMHIMSSAIHKNVFINIKSLYPKYMMLPYFKDGYIGVRLVAFKNSNILGLNNSNHSPEELAELFAGKPDKYIELADNITNVFKDIEDSCILILLRDFSIWKMTRALSQHGFNVLCCEEVSSNTFIDANEYHANLPGYNSFTNIIGSLITNVNKTVDKGKVEERSVYIYLMARHV